MPDAVVELSYNGFDMLKDVEAWSEDLSASLSEQKLVERRGALLPSTLEGPRIAHIKAKMFGTGANPKADLRSQRAALDSALSVSEPRPLILFQDRQIDAVRESVRYTPIEGMPQAWSVEIDFICPDPLWRAVSKIVDRVEAQPSGSVAELFSWGVDSSEFTGNAPTPPELRFTLLDSVCTLTDYTYYGPNLLTNTRFTEGESADPGVPVDWEDDSELGESHLSFGDQEAWIHGKYNTTVGTHSAVLSQDIPFTEPNVTLCAQVEVRINRNSHPDNRITLQIEQYDSSDTQIGLDHITLATADPEWPGYEDWSWFTLSLVEDAVGSPIQTNAGVSYIRFRVGVKPAEDPDTGDPGEIGINLRNPALLRGTDTPFFPGHFSNIQWSLDLGGSSFSPGEVVRVDNTNREVWYYTYDDRVSAWEFFTGDEPFFELQPIQTDEELHFSLNQNGLVYRMMEYNSRFWQP